MSNCFKRRKHEVFLPMLPATNLLYNQLICIAIYFRQFAVLPPNL